MSNPDSKLPPKQQFQKMNDKVSTPSKAMAETLDQCKDQLRDAYMNFSDLQERCVIKINEKPSKDEPTVFYFKPETFLLQDPDYQRQYRDNLLKKIAGVPKPEPVTYLGDEIHRSFAQTIGDRSTASRTKKTLHEYFLRRQYSLQHLKYKVLVRWAHHALSSETTEMIGSEAAFMYGKLEFNLEQAMKRCERLGQTDFYDQAIPKNRPSTRAGEGQGALYVENFDLDPQSLIREDDIEVYIRGISYRNKINKLVNKFMSRLKWLPMEQRYDILTQAVKMHHEIKETNIQSQIDFKNLRSKKCRDAHLINVNQEIELKAIEENSYCNVYANLFVNHTDKIKNSWKSNHDIVPDLVSDQYTLKLQILSRSTVWNLNGDIELDHGYSFTYQITTFFPTYFQKQVIKSQFSIYDLFAHQDDKNAIQKRTLSSMIRIDTNIFRDISSAKGSVPTDEALGQELRNSDIKVIRLKSAAYWIDYVILTPNEPDWHKKQQALLSNENNIDALLKAGFNFIDVNDLATINRINEDNAILHQQNIKKILKDNPHNQAKDFKVYTQDGDKNIKVDYIGHKNGANSAANIEAHLLRGVQDPCVQEETEEVATTTTRTSLRYCSQHLLTALYTLRFISSRDYKTKILYTLNYFRSVQKRLAIDLREFGTRERMDAHMTDPFVRSNDANQQVLASSQRSVGIWVKTDIKSRTDSEFKEPHKNLTVFDEKAIGEMNNMATLRGYKCNGYFNNKIFSTCPSFPKFHDTFGEPTHTQPVAEEQDDQGRLNKNLSTSAIKFMGRIDHIELNEITHEVYVKDDFGVYILYDCVLQDMQSLEGELCKIASFYLNKSELLIDPTISGVGSIAPVKDRLQVIDDILRFEAEFNFKKVRLTQVYMECYEHIIDPLEQQKIMQIITDITARRPRLNLTANYFQDSYTSELKCLDVQFELVRAIVDTQVSLEKTENRRLQEVLNLSFSIANQFEKNQWKYQDSSLLLETLIKEKKEKEEEKRRELRAGMQYQLDKKMFTQDKDDLTKDHTTTQRIIENGVQNGAQNPLVSGAKALNDDASSDFNEDDYFRTDDNQFTALLGLPQISIETIYASYMEKDATVIEMMNENANFITTYEGYPEFLTHLIRKSIKNNTIFKPNTWSQETGALDFYDSLDCVNRYYSIMLNVAQELYDALKPHDSSFMTCIETCVTQQALEEYRKVIRIMEGAVLEYTGREYVENEQILGNSEKQIFYAKEMISDLTSKPKIHLDPFIVAKIDIQTINFFDFPKQQQNQNKYTLRSNGFSGEAYLKECDRLALAGMGKKNAKKTEGLSSNLPKQSDIIGNRNVNVPRMLEVYCNLVELHRLRNEIILTASETVVLKQIYKQQCEVANCKNIKIEISDGISFVTIDTSDGDTKLINFVDEGPSHNLEIDLAIKEFDPVLLSNFNFLNPDTFKLNILTSGLEEVRAILQYQLYFKFLLVTATRTNQVVLDQHQRAIAELNILNDIKQDKYGNKRIVSLPNPVVNLNSVLSRVIDGIDSQKVKEVMQSYKSNLSSCFAPVFYNVQTKKSQNRSAMAIEFGQFQNIASQTFVANPYCTLRVMRSFKLKLLTRFVQGLMNEVCLDAQKIQILTSCNRLRYFNRYFSFNPLDLGLTGEPPAVFKYETSSLIENFPSNYFPSQFNEDFQMKFGKDKSVDIKVINTSEFKIIDFRAIPSSASILLCNSSEIEDMNEFKSRKEQVQARYLSGYKQDLKQIAPDINHPEQHLKAMLPTFTPIGDELMTPKKLEPDQQVKKPKFGMQSPALDYAEAMYYGDSKVASLAKYYIGLERIITLEWFINKLQFKTNEVVYLEQAIETGLPFWKEDDFDARPLNALQKAPKLENQQNQKAQQFYYDQVVSLRQKKQLAQELTSFSQVLKSFLAEYQRTKIDLRSDYMEKYTEFRYLQIVGSLHKLVQQFYYQKKISSVQTIQSALGNLTKMDHVRVKCISKGNYNVCSALVHPQMQIVEAGNLIYGSIQSDQIFNFQRCIQPILNEKALEPSQITMFQSIYQNDSQRRTNQTQFIGQTCSTIINPFQALETALLSLNHTDRVYSQSFIVQAKYQANDFMETVYGDTSMASLTNEDVYNLGQLKDSMEFLQQNTRALLLRNAVMCWGENSTMPSTSAIYQQFEANFREHFFWKILEQKKDIMQKWSSQLGNSVPSNKEIEELKNRINNLQDDKTLATKSAEDKRDAMVRALKAEFEAMKKKVTLDTWFTTKAEIELFSNEIEKFIMQASISALDSECAALAKCFTVQVPTIQMHIHPFQQFAATFFDQVDPNLHLDVSNKISAVQVLLTRLKNRGTSVETLTSGPGMVFTIKDLNECLLDFCRSIVVYSEKELKSRQALHSAQDQHYYDNLYMKDQKINWLEHRINQIGLNLENIIDSRLFEKGNQLIYELDSSNRLLQLFKRSFYGLEHSLTAKIQGEQFHKFKRKQNIVEEKSARFVDYLDFIKKEVGADFASELERIKEVLKQKTSEAINQDGDVKYKKPEFYPANGTHQYIGQSAVNQNGKRSSIKVQLPGNVISSNGVPVVLPGAVVPKGFTHYSHCSCYVPDERFPRPTLEMAELEMMSEQEARSELIRMCVLVRKQRLLWRTKEMCSQQKFQDKINMLTKQQSNNTYLWEQMAEAQKRERVLQQELKFTQQSLAAAEKVIDKLKEEIRDVEADRSRLNKYKTSKSQRLNELEDQVKKIELFDNIDTDKLLMALTKKDKQIKNLQSTQEVFDMKLAQMEQRRDTDIHALKRNYNLEQKKTQQVIDKMDQMKLELKMLESNDSSVASIWKKKCMDIFEVCQTMKQENEELRSRCKELIDQGINLAEAIGDYQNKSIGSEVDSIKYSSVQAQKMIQQQHSQMAPNSQGRQMVSTAGTFSVVQDSPMQKYGKQNHINPLVNSEMGIVTESGPAWALQSPANLQFKQTVPLTAQNQRGKTVGAAGAAMLGLQVTPQNGRPKNDLKAILTGTAQSYNLDKSLQSRDYKQPTSQTQSNQKYPSVITVDDTKMAEKMQQLKTDKTRRLDKKHQDSIFNSTSKTHTFSQNAAPRIVTSAEGADSSFQGARVWANQKNTEQFDIQGAPFGVMRGNTGHSSQHKISAMRKNEDSQKRPIDIDAKKMQEPNLGLMSQTSEIADESHLQAKKRYNDSTVEMKEEDQISV